MTVLCSTITLLPNINITHQVAIFVSKDGISYMRNKWNLLTRHFSFSGKGTGLGSLASSQSVCFRQGTNVEFGSNSFNANGSSGVSGPETLDIAYNLDPVNNKNRDFHNPMYDAVQRNPDVVGNGSSGKLNMHFITFWIHINSYKIIIVSWLNLSA